MGYPTKVQLISRKKGADQYYINFPTAIAEAMEFQKGEINEPPRRKRRGIGEGELILYHSVN